MGCSCKYIRSNYKYIGFSCKYIRSNCNFIKFIVKFLQDKKKYRKRRAKISADISARLFRVTSNKSQVY